MNSGSGIFFGGRYLTYSDLDQDCFGVRERIPFGVSININNPNALELQVALHSLDGHVSEIVVSPPSFDTKGGSSLDGLYFNEGQFQAEYLNSPQLARNLSVAEFISRKVSTKIVIHTSGTSGTPKAISHELKELKNQFSYQKKSEVDAVWGLLYQTSRMAAIQLILNSYVRGESVVCPESQMTLKDKVELFKLCRVNALSGTPSMFRYLLQIDDFCRLVLKQITLGGERVDQDILDSLKHHFPDARITHIYASTEVGFGFAVSDGKAGFPSDYFSRTFDRFRLECVNNELVFVFHPDSTHPSGYKIFSGDIVDQSSERVHFIGRNSSVANVGGLKVFPEEVEEIIRTLSGITNAHVYAVKSSQMGEILMAKVTGPDTINPSLIRARLKELLPPHKVPASIELVKEITISPGGKLLRQ